MKLDSSTNASLRQRKQFTEDDDFVNDSDDKLIQQFRKFDLFDKVQTNVASTQRIQTEFGGLSSICTLTLIGWLILSQTFYYFFPYTHEHLIVDKMFDKKLEITFDIEFHRIPCNSLGVDVMDITGDQQLHVEKDITKTRLDYSGKPLRNQNQDSDNKHTHSNDNPNELTIEQIMGFGDMFKHLRVDDVHKEGCRVFGSLHLQKVNGNFHLALGSAHEIQGKHIHQFVMSDVPKFNCSHTVHKLSFGRDFYNKYDPLTGIQHIIEQEGGGVFTYYIKVIPTVFEGGWFSDTLYTNQYTYDYSYRHIPIPKPGERPMAALPGVFFVYKMNPYSVQITYDSETSFIQFLVNLSAIVGGIFAVSGLIDSLMYHFAKQIYQLMGKSDDNNVFYGDLRSPMNVSSKSHTRI